MNLIFQKYPDIYRILDGERSPEEVLELLKKAKEANKPILG